MPEGGAGGGEGLLEAVVRVVYAPVCVCVFCFVCVFLFVATCDHLL